MTKTCKVCGKIKAVDEFPTPKSKTPNQCLQCIAAYKRQWYAKNRESQRERNRQYKKNNPHRQRATRYGLTVDEVSEILNNPCGICGGKTEVIDHDHDCCPGTKSCGKCIRGGLCFRCNGALGVLGDNLRGINRAVEYLSKDSWRS